ncbi:MAG: acyltransferase [bacterium]
MNIHIANSATETFIFIFVLTCLLFLSLRPKEKNDDNIIPQKVTQELKGFAILAVVFSHIGYYLVDDKMFLFPLSIMAGVGVNLFLLLSGFGLSSSLSNNKKQPVKYFYSHELPKLYIPLWYTLCFYIFFDFIKKIIYSPTTIIESFLGFFPQANLYKDINSPLWYFTLILFYYLLFPIVFNKKYPWLSALGIFITSFFLISNLLPLSSQVINLYTVHMAAFPIGMCLYWLTSKKQVKKIIKLLSTKITEGFYLALISTLIFIIFYSALNSYVGQVVYKEQFISIFTSLCIFTLFTIKKNIFRLFSIFGLYSYEIYLIHWPLMYRYNFLYSHFNPWLATVFYLCVFVCFGWILKKISNYTIVTIKVFLLRFLY